jgi:hypothetical protein
MKYWLDTELIEGFKKPIKWLPTIGKFNKPYHSIQLISIGIVAEDGRTYYAISNEFNWKDANNWVKGNVLLPILREEVTKYNEKASRIGVHSSLDLDLSAIEVIQKFVGKSNKRIAFDILKFVLDPNNLAYNDWIGSTDDFYKALGENGTDGLTPTEFYAYYADYDWVVFCSLFGTMMDLPKQFPMYCKDLKQMLDEKVDKMTLFGKNGEASFDEKLEMVKYFAGYPAQENEHNAIADAQWNLDLYNFITKLLPI